MVVNKAAKNGEPGKARRMAGGRYEELMAARKERRLSVEERDELLALKGERTRERGTAQVRRARERMAKREAAHRMAVGASVLEAGVSSEDPTHLAAVIRYGEALIAAGFVTDDDDRLHEGAARLAEWLREVESGEYR